MRPHWPKLANLAQKLLNSVLVLRCIPLFQRKTLISFSLNRFYYFGNSTNQFMPEQKKRKQSMSLSKFRSIKQIVSF